MSKVLKSCPFCGSQELILQHVASDPHFGIPGSYRLVRCRACALVFTNPMYSDEELSAMYPADYYSFQPPPVIDRFKRQLKKLLGYWQGTKEPGFERAGVFLDVGCGSGAFVDEMRRRGWDSYGVETSKRAADLGRCNGLQIHCGQLDRANFPDAYFDYVRASHSLEHMAAPRAALHEMARILKPGGVLLIAVPNVDSLNARIFKRYWWHLCPPIHCFAYSPRTLNCLLRETGFRVTRVVFNSDYVGLLGSVQIWLNRRGRRRSHQGRCFNSYPLRVISGWLQTAADLLRMGDMIEITAVRDVSGRNEGNAHCCENADISTAARGTALTCP